MGVDAILLLNHRGRQLDRAPVPFHLFRMYAARSGTALKIHLDTGIMSGQDIVAALAVGADFALIGRAYRYGLMAGGRRGVDRAVAILRMEVERTMRLLGVGGISELHPDHVTQLHRLASKFSAVVVARSRRA